MQSHENTARDLVSRMTLEEKIALTIGRDFWTSHGVERLGIAPISLNDGPHGLRKPAISTEVGLGTSLPSTCFPTAAALAASWDTALVEEVGRAIGEECQALDVQVVLGPGINIKRTPLGGRSFEYYSEDPLLAGELGSAFVAGVQSQGVGTSLKHFACNNQEYERMTIDAEIDERTMREIYLPAFERVVRQANPWTVMCSYNRVNGLFASEHPQLLRSILKEEWGYDGVVVSDWGAVNVKEHALAAGLDLEMPGHAGHHTTRIAQAVHEGRLSEAALDEAAVRMVRLILRGHAHRRADVTLDTAGHHALARRAAAESMVLLKNDHDLLPLAAEALTSVAAIGRFARYPRFQGAGSSQVVPTQVDISYDALRDWLNAGQTLTYSDGYPAENDASSAATLLSEAVAAAQAAEVAIIFAGLPDSYESEGFDRPHIHMPESHNRLIAAVCRVQPRTIIVLHNGSVVAMPWVDAPQAILEAGLGGQAMGSAVVDVLAGRVTPCGKLAETFPLRLEDTPAYLCYPGENNRVRYGEGLFVGYRYYDTKQVAPLFPFGYGLSYTTFAYSNLRLSQPTISAQETITATVTVRNTGTRAGKEIVQLYTQMPTSAYARPSKELRAFAKVDLAVGASADVTLTIAARDLMVYDIERQGWRLEGGEITVLVGPSSRETPLHASLSVLEDARSARVIYTPFSSLKQILSTEKGRSLLMQAVQSNELAHLIVEGNEMLSAFPLIKATLFGMLPDDGTVQRLVDAMNAD